MCLSNFAVGLTTGILTHRIRIRENLTRDREEKTNLMNQILQDIASSQNKTEFTSKVCSRISHQFQGITSVVLKSKNGNLQLDKVTGLDYWDEKEQAVAQWSFQNLKNAEWSTDTLNQARSYYIPLRGISESVGVFIYRPERKIHKLSIDQKEFLHSVATQLGISIERPFLRRRLEIA